ncbi:MAG TPA: ABC transporter substrate-binding protein [Elusimicrobia bacterium]|jgi:NitT/TauT family transport system substrate-binding protein|nr:ABC transporter substrate-binding protein [Elusimicrobiota bacterium]
MFCKICVCAERVKKTSLLPLWEPQAQFAGYYVAYEKGIYKKYGLDVTIIKGGPDYPPDQWLEKGKVDFAIMWLSAGIQQRFSGVRILNVGQIIQRSALMLVAKKSSGIKSPKDIDGKKVSLWDGLLRLQPIAFFNKYGLKVKIIPQSYSVNLFLRGGVDVVSAMWYNEYHTILSSGINEDELVGFFFDKHELNFPEDGIYTLEKTFQKDPALSLSFVKASIEGWKYAFEHPDEALDIVLKYMRIAGIPANRVHQKWMLDRMKDIILTDNDYTGIGILKQSDYDRVASELKKNSLVKNIPNFEEFFVSHDKKYNKK